MNPTIPATADVQAGLKGLSPPQLRKLAELSGVPYFTLLKVRSGETTNPGIETVRKFVPHIDAARLEAA